MSMGFGARGWVRDPTMKKWTDMLSRLGGGSQFQFDAKFFSMVGPTDSGSG
jgi:hypothetical protein